MEDTHYLLRESVNKIGRAAELYGNVASMEHGSIREGLEDEVADLDADETDALMLHRIVAEDDGDNSVGGRAGRAFAKQKRIEEQRKRESMAAVTEYRFSASQIRTFDHLRSVYVGHRTRLLMTEQQAEHVAAARIQLKWWYFYSRRINAARRIQAWFRCMIFREILQGCMIAKQAVAEALRQETSRAGPVRRFGPSGPPAL
jgi:hypothetical protein